MDNLIETSTIVELGYKQPKDRFVLDWDKIKTVDDCKRVMRAFICGMSPNIGDVIICDNSPFYEELKHLSK